jgi:type IV secretion system protein TrbL
MGPANFGIFQQVLFDFQNATHQWLGELYTVGVHLFWMIAAIEIVLLGITNALRREWEYLLIDLARAVGGIGAMYLLLQNGPDWLQHGLIASFALWGGMTGGVPANAMDPGSVMQQGFILAEVLLKAVANGSWLHMAANMTVTILCGIAVIICFALVGIILLETLIEGYVACTAGTVLVATSGSRFTHRFAERYFGWALGIGIRLFFLYLILGLGYVLVGKWQLTAEGHSTEILTNIYYPVEAVIEALILLILVGKIPNHAAQMVESTVSLTLGDIVLGNLISSSVRNGISAAAGAGVSLLTGAQTTAATVGGAAKDRFQQLRQALMNTIPNGHDGNHGAKPTQPLQPGDFGQQTQPLNGRGPGGRP